MQKRARPYKQFLVTPSVIDPLMLLLPWPVRPLLADVPVLDQRLVENLIVTALVVGLMPCLVMPRYVRLAADWLYR